MARLTEHAAALGKYGAKQKWSGTTGEERKKIMALVRDAKKRKPKMSDNFAIANAVLQRQNHISNGGR
jgi:hypothetical protein